MDDLSKSSDITMKISQLKKENDLLIFKLGNLQVLATNRMK